MFGRNSDSDTNSWDHQRGFPRPSPGESQSGHDGVFNREVMM